MRVCVCRLGYFRGGFIFSQLAQNVTAREIKNSAEINEAQSAPGSLDSVSLFVMALLI